jgi:formate-dependent nitrite reductase cytochrome c552 subunit
MFPETARKANIQCENCHGPQVGGAHLPNDPEGTPRVSLSSNVCATCHGEPLRHARFQQWQLSPHANYELAIDEGDSGSCSRCHTGNGFLTWLPVLLGDEPGDPLDDVEVTWTSDEVHPQTCQTCHDPHAIGTTSGDGSNATVRISGDTPPLIAGFTATDVGRGAICMTCHNTRRGLRNDDTFNDYFGTSEAARAPHGGAQADMLMGQNAYLVDVGQRANHSLTSKVEDTCVTCHMEETPPPADLAYNLGGSNHTFYASKDICQNCHTNLAAETIQGPVEEQLHQLQDMIESALYGLIDELTEAGNSIDVNGDATITDASQIADIEFGETRGRQAMAIEFSDGSSVEMTRMTDIDVVPAMGESFPLYNAANPFLIKAGWNWNLVHNDGSLGVHNPLFTFQVLDRSMDALTSGLEPCGPDADTMCLQGNRFKVEVTWRTQDGSTGSGMVAPCGTDDSGIFYFFSDNNWEMLFKVLNGCSINDHYWVFFAATTNVEFTTRVTDTLTGFAKSYSSSGESIEYTNPLGQPANAVTDTTAFATCP